MFSKIGDLKRKFSFMLFFFKLTLHFLFGLIKKKLLGYAYCNTISISLQIII